MSLTNNNLLYLPVILLNNVDDTALPNENIASGSHAVLVDKDTVDEFGANGPNDIADFIDGFNGPGPQIAGMHIRLDQGLHTTEISSVFNIDAELTENQYIVEIDNRFGSIVGPDSGEVVNPSFIDDDNIASYYLSTSPFVKNLVTDQPEGNATNSVITGPRGTLLEFFNIGLFESKNISVPI